VFGYAEPPLTYGLELTWQTAYYDGTTYQYTGAIATASQQLPCDNLSNEVVNFYLGDNTPFDNLAIYLSVQTKNILPVIIYSAGTNPLDKTVVTVKKPTPGIGPSITLEFITSSTYDLTYNYTALDTSPEAVATHLAAAIKADSTAGKEVTAAPSGPSVTLRPIPPYYAGYPNFKYGLSGGAQASVISYFSDGVTWARGSYWPDDAIIFWYQGSSLGSQTLFHELDHHYYEGLKVLNPQCLSNCIYTTTLNVGGTPIKFNWETSKAGGNAYYSLEHMLIHNDLVHAYGGDTTGALTEAFTYSVPVATTDQSVTIGQHYGQSVVPLDQPTPSSAPISGQKCPATMLSRPVTRFHSHVPWEVQPDLAD